MCETWMGGCVRHGWGCARNEGGEQAVKLVKQVRPDIAAATFDIQRHADRGGPNGK